MNFRRTCILALIVLGCSTPRTESPADSLAVAPDSLSSTGTTADEAYEDYTQYKREIKDIKSSFNGPQLKPTTGFVHRQAGLHLYKTVDEGGDTTRSAGVIRYGESVNLAEALVNYQKGDTESVDGFLGRYVAVNTPDGLRYIFSGYLSNFPVPAEGESMVDYLLNHLHLVAPPDQQRGTDSTDIYTASQYNDIYQFESDVKVEDHGYYEGSGTEIMLPSSCSLQEGFLLLRSFAGMDSYKQTFTRWPEKAEERTVEEGITAVVEMGDDGRPKSIKVIDETGCYDETFVSIAEGKVLISTGGGC